MASTFVAIASTRKNVVPTGLCIHNKTGTTAGARNNCVSKTLLKFCMDCNDVESKKRKLYDESVDDKGISDMEHIRRIMH